MNYTKHMILLMTIPAPEREKLEKQVFKMSINEIWDSCVSFFTERDPHQIERAKNNPKRKMALNFPLVFRAFLALV